MADEGPTGADGRTTPERLPVAPTEEALAQLLTERGPLLRQRQEVDAPDAAFVARVRAQLLGDQATVPTPEAAPRTPIK